MPNKKDEMTEDDRIIIEDAIYDAHQATDRYLESGRDLHEKLLEITVDDALAALQMYADLLKDDPLAYNYKIHMLIPTTLREMLKDHDNQVR
jgi:hypothetical protein